MGTSPICTTTTTNSKPNLFDQAESVAFQHVNANLRDMPGCCLGDLAQAAKSYFFESVRASGAAHLFREEYVERKAERSAAWWYRKHRDIRTPRPHSKYSPAQALRGRQVSAIRKASRNDWQALRVQLARQGGAKVAEVAEILGCSARFVYKLSKRKFSPLLVAVLLAALGLNDPKSSVGVTPDLTTGRNLKEELRSFSLDEDAGPVTAVNGFDGAETDGTDEIDRLGLAIPDLLQAHWAAQPL